MSAQATARGNLLAPEGPAYKALVLAVPELDSATLNIIPESLATRLIAFAKAGLPIIFVGNAPLLQEDKSADRLSTNGPLQQLLHTKGVYKISGIDELPDTLEKLKISPLISPSCSVGTVRSLMRSNSTAATDHIFLFNDQNTTTTCNFSIPQKSQAIPYLYDPWTGDQQAIVEYSRHAVGLSVTLKFQVNQTKIVALKTQGHVTTPQLVGTVNENVANVKVLDNGVVRLGLRGAAKIKSNSGKTWSFESKQPKSTNLTTWDLSIQDIHAPEDRFEVKNAITVHEYKSVPLKAWSLLAPGLDKVGGIGTYATKFTAPSSRSTGAILHLGPIIHTLRVYIDGKRLPPVDAWDPQVDISDSIKPGGTHTLKIEVTTPLFNRIKADANETMIWSTVAGQAQPLYGSLPPQEYGLIGPVSIEWISLYDLH